LTGNTWDGVEAPVPNNAAATSAGLFSVVCVAADSCTAVGAYDDLSGDDQVLIDTVSAGVWQATEAPLPGNAGGDLPIAYLSSVACASAGSCTAVGTYGDTADNTEGLIETLSKGTWQVEEAPLPSDASDSQDVILDAVACPSSRFCTTVGTYYGASGKEDLIEALSGGVWTAIEAPLPSDAAGGGETLSSVVCPSTDTCLAVGTYLGSSDVTLGVIDTLSGGTWGATEAPTGSPETDSVDSFGPVACASRTKCAALVSHASNSQGLIDTLSKGTWHTTNAMSPSNASSFEASLNSVACPSTGACTVAGTYDNSSGDTRDLIGTLSGGTWSALDAPLPSGAPDITVSSFGPVACASATVCDIAGEVGFGGYGEPFIDALSGGTWTSGVAPGPSDSDSRTTTVADVACGPPSTCAVVGSYDNFELQIGSGFINGSTAPLPSNSTMFSNSGLSSVSCPGSTCIAVGGYEDSSGNDQGLIVTLSGGSTEAPLLANAASNPQVGLASVACVSSSACTAVGSYEDTSGDTDGLVDTLTEGTWSATEVPLPANAFAGNADVSLGPIACGTAGSCAVLGKYKDALGNENELIDTLSDGTWRAIEAPLPAGASTLISLSSVACSSATKCYTVGTYDDSSGDSHGLLDTLSKGTWEANEAPVPSNAGSSPEASLRSISCAPGGGCMSVGGYTDASGTAEGLIESIK